MQDVQVVFSLIWPQHSIWHSIWQYILYINYMNEQLGESYPVTWKQEWKATFQNHIFRDVSYPCPCYYVDALYSRSWLLKLVLLWLTSEREYVIPPTYWESARAIWLSWTSGHRWLWHHQDSSWTIGVFLFLVFFFLLFTFQEHPRYTDFDNSGSGFSWLKRLENHGPLAMLYAHVMVPRLHFENHGQRSCMI